ncbi:MAG: tRNA (adenosine(37)-N6)-threonylcarbamoyltransferase complex dimerization subunit type 1 TsaB [Bacteroidota bacterium]
MGLILCIETATEVCSVCLSRDGHAWAVKEITEPNRHASLLSPLIDEILKENGHSFNQLDAVAVSKGPGSYTGLRVGVSTTKGLCYALDKPLIAVPTLQALAALAQKQISSKEPYTLIPMIDARRMEVFTAAYNHLLEESTATHAHIIDESSFASQQLPSYYFGNGAAKCVATLTHPNLHYLANIQCSASGMAALAEAAFIKQRFEDVAYVEPYYLKDFVGTTPKNK